MRKENPSHWLESVFLRWNSCHRCFFYASQTTLEKSISSEGRSCLTFIRSKIQMWNIMSGVDKLFCSSISNVMTCETRVKTRLIKHDVSLLLTDVQISSQPSDDISLTWLHSTGPIWTCSSEGHVLVEVVVKSFLIGNHPTSSRWAQRLFEAVTQMIDSIMVRWLFTFDSRLYFRHSSPREISWIVLKWMDGWMSTCHCRTERPSGREVRE